MDRAVSFGADLQTLWNKKGYVSAEQRKAILAKWQELAHQCIKTDAPPSFYTAKTDRDPHPPPPAPALGPAGFRWTDPTFGASITRVTDVSTNEGAAVHVPSNALVSAWNADASMFYLLGAGGNVLLFAFDGHTPTRLATAVPSSNVEPSFSFSDPKSLYVVSGPHLRTVQRFDVTTDFRTDVIDLDLAYPSLTLANTYVGGLQTADGDSWAVFFGGLGQDDHHYIRHSSGTLFDSLAQPVPFKLHAIGLDWSGRYVVAFPRGGDVTAVGSPAVIWDTQTNTTTAVPAPAGGHWSLGYGQAINADCCTAGTWDALQWQKRTLSAPTAATDLISVLLPKAIYVGEHSSWRAAKWDASVPMISATYRYGDGRTAPWRAWDNEIIGVATDGSGTVWRFAHHHATIDGNFWNQPLMSVSPDGRFVLFDSDWDGTVGAGRQDVFLLEAK